MHSYQILAERKRKQQQSSFSTGSSGEGTPRRKTVLQSLFLGESDDEEEISLQHVEELADDPEKYKAVPVKSSYLGSSLGIKIQQSTFSRSS